MTPAPQLLKIAFVGDYPPRNCGIATFTRDLRDSVAARHPEIECSVLAVNDLTDGYDYPHEVRFQLQEQRLRDYRDAAQFLRLNRFDVLCLQHEFGIYGGPSGAYVMALLDEATIPVVTTLHTILEEPTADQRRVMSKITSRSQRLVVMTKRGKQMLEQIYAVASDKIDVIPHGIPETSLVNPDEFKEAIGVENKHVLLTFGLLSPGKGIEYVIHALPEITAHHPDLIYVVAGVTHPNLVRDEGELYRFELERLATKLGMSKHVAFHNHFVGNEELKQLISAADIYVTPYLNKAQITSGTLCYAFGAGKVVVSTPYWHAEELLADGRGVLVPFRDSDAIAQAIIDLLNDKAKLRVMAEQAYRLGQETTWDRTAGRYFGSFQKARLDHRTYLRPGFTVRTLAQEPLDLPELKLDHLDRLTDTVGIFQHALFAMPNYAHGYCTDDNAVHSCSWRFWKRTMSNCRPKEDWLRRTPRSFNMPSIRTSAAFGTSCLSIDVGWTRWARTTVMAVAYGRSAPV